MSFLTPATYYCFPLAAFLLVWGSSCKSSALPKNTVIVSKSGRTPLPTLSEVPNGLWGGLHISMEVTDKGAQLNYDCAHGSITEKIVPDQTGRFLVKGFHVREHAGPNRQDEDPKGIPSNYEGTLSGQTMKLAVTLSESNETVGTFTLTRGQIGKVRKCM